MGHHKRQFIMFYLPKVHPRGRLLLCLLCNCKGKPFDLHLVLVIQTLSQLKSRHQTPRFILIYRKSWCNNRVSLHHKQHERNRWTQTSSVCAPARACGSAGCQWGLGRPGGQRSRGDSDVSVLSHSVWTAPAGPAVSPPTHTHTHTHIVITFRHLISHQCCGARHSVLSHLGIELLSALSLRLQFFLRLLESSADKFYLRLAALQLHGQLTVCVGRGGCDFAASDGQSHLKPGDNS